MRNATADRAEAPAVCKEMGGSAPPLALRQESILQLCHFVTASHALGEAGMAEATDRRVKLALVWTGRAIEALVLAYLFIVILMAASAQSHIAAKLTPPADYSSSYADWQRSLETEASLNSLRKQREQTRSAIETETLKNQDAGNEFLTLEAPIRPLQARLQSYPDCAFTFDQNSYVADMLSSLQYCVAVAELPSALSGEIKRVLEKSDQLRTAQSQWLKSQGELGRLTRYEASLGANIGDLEKQLPALSGARGAFSELMVTRANAWLGGELLVEFPPSMVQILLAFSSGLFGALLVTLVLIVYPNNELNIASAHGRYEARVLLGGLVSLCVFVVMGGGSAVLGTGSAFSGGGSNILAFCAIGILAGMFSDRVAYWLSARARSLFKEEDDVAKKAADAASASDHAKHAADLAAAANAEAAQAAALRATEEAEAELADAKSA